MAHFRKQLTNAAPHYYFVLLLFILFIKTLLKSPSPEILRHDDSHQMADNLGINKIQGQSPSLKSTDTLQKRTEIYSLQKFQFHWAHVRQAWKLYLSVAVLIHLGRLSIFCIFTKFWMGIYGIDWQCNIQIASGKQTKKKSSAVKQTSSASSFLPQPHGYHDSTPGVAAQVYHFNNSQKLLKRNVHDKKIVLQHFPTGRN